MDFRPVWSMGSLLTSGNEPFFSTHFITLPIVSFASKDPTILDNVNDDPKSSAFSHCPHQIWLFKVGLAIFLHVKWIVQANKKCYVNCNFRIHPSPIGNPSASAKGEVKWSGRDLSCRKGKRGKERNPQTFSAIAGVYNNMYQSMQSCKLSILTASTILRPVNHQWRLINALCCVLMLSFLSVAFFIKLDFLQY